MSKTPHAPHALLGGSSDASDVQHLTGFTAPDPFLCIQDRGWSHLIVSSLELGRAQALPGRVVCHAIQDLDLADGKRGLGDQLLAFLVSKQHQVVRVSPRCPIGIVRTLEAGGIQVEIQSDPQRPTRIRKTPEEIRALSEAQKAAVAGVRTARELIASASISSSGLLKGPNGNVLTSEGVRAAISHTLLDHGCTADEIIVAGGDQAVDPHERGHGPLRAGEWIILDVFPVAHSGYWGDITRTVMKGQPSPEQRKLYQTVLRAQKAALQEVRAGVTGDEIHRNIVHAFEQAGYATGMIDGVPQGFIHSTGHGVGLDIHEAPRISPGAGALKSGMVITIEPGLYYRGLGGVRIEDTVVVTKDGFDWLAKATKQGVLP